MDTHWRLEQGDAHALARGLVAEALGVPVVAVALTHHCPTCGSDAHGRPVPLVDGAPAPLHLSLSRTRLGRGSAAIPYAAAAVSGSAIGVDVQAWQDTDFAGFDEVALHDAEARPGSLEERARLWAAKEAVLKLRGTGLERDPRELDLGELRGIRLRWLPAPQGLSLALAES